jgi:hypothetical protein
MVFLELIVPEVFIYVHSVFWASSHLPCYIPLSSLPPFKKKFGEFLYALSINM